jgi:hypothetical protein
MFFYEIRVSRKRRFGTGTRRTVTTDYMEALKPSYVGEKVASLLEGREVQRVTVEPISQAKFIRETRGE